MRSSGNNQASSTWRLVSAFQSLKAHGITLTTAAVFREVARLPPTDAPMPVLRTCSGTDPITFAFEPPFTLRTPRNFVRLRPHTNSELILTKITIRDSADDAMNPSNGQLRVYYQT